MKKEDLKLHELPESYAADSKYCRLRKSEDFEIGLFSWTEEDEAADNFYTEEFQIADFFQIILHVLIIAMSLSGSKSKQKRFSTP